MFYKSVNNLIIASIITATQFCTNFAKNSEEQRAFSKFRYNLEMVSRSEKSQKRLDKIRTQFHTSVHPEDDTPFFRPTDAELYDFVDNFTEKYSWREDIFRDEIDVKVFSGDNHKLAGQAGYDVLRWLRKEKFLHFTTVDDDGWLLVSDVDDIALNQLLGTLNPAIKPAEIEYSPSTSIVIFNGVRHSMHSNGESHKIFRYLAMHPNERISKERIWRCINKRVTSKRERNSFSSLIARVRNSVGASDKEILLDNTVTLNATVKIID